MQSHRIDASQTENARGRVHRGVQDSVKEDFRQPLPHRQIDSWNSQRAILGDKHAKRHPRLYERAGEG